MSEPLENLYFNWLCERVQTPEVPTPSTSYNRLFRHMHNTEFVFLVVGDDNRGADGVELRVEFLHLADIPADEEWLSYPCSVFEMLVAFSIRACRQTDSPEYEWFWHILGNIDLLRYNDVEPYDAEAVRETLDRVLWRHYGYSGLGGLFPLNRPNVDQRNVELWYQFSAYLTDKE